MENDGEQEKWKKIAENSSEHECKNDKCKLDIYELLRLRFRLTLCPCVGPDDWAYNSSEVVIDKLIKDVKEFNEAHFEH